MSTAKRKELTVEQKQIILNLSKEGYSAHKIAGLVNIDRSTISKLLKRIKQRGNIENTHRSGRPRKTDLRGDRRLLRVVKTNRRKTLTDLTLTFNNETPVKISKATVKRRLRFYGFKRRVVKKKTVISLANRTARRAWCRSKIHWSVPDNWSKVIFSDETQVVLGKDNKVYIWRRDEEKYLPRCLGVHADPIPFCKASVMFWGCITHDGVGTLTPVDGNINSEKYIEILDSHLWPVIAKCFPNKPYIFQDDNATPHRSKRTSEWKRMNNIPTILWPAQSPDINIIENVWRLLKVHLRRQAGAIKNREDLIRTVLDIWGAFSPTYICSLYNSLPRRIRQVLRANESITKY